MSELQSITKSTPAAADQKQQESAEFPARGKHLLLTLSGCNFNILNDEAQMHQLAHDAAVSTGASVLQVISQRFSPQGVTALVLLAESHASLHTYPEAGVVFWDCFTCGDRCDPELSINVLKQRLQPTKVDFQTIVRQ